MMDNKTGRRVVKLSLQQRNQLIGWLREKAPEIGEKRWTIPQTAREASDEVGYEVTPGHVRGAYRDAQPPIRVPRPAREKGLEDVWALRDRVRELEGQVARIIGYLRGGVPLVDSGI